MSSNEDFCGVFSEEATTLKKRPSDKALENEENSELFQSDRTPYDDEEDRSPKRLKLDLCDNEPSTTEPAMAPTRECKQRVDGENATPLGSGTIHDRNFDEDYNEESDQDWAGGSESDSDGSSPDQELLGNAFGAEDDVADIDVDGFDDDSVYQPPWTSFSEEEMKNIQEEARVMGLMKFIEKYVIHEKVPVAKLLEAFNVVMHPRAALLATDLELIPILRSVVNRHLRKRRRLELVKTLEDVVELMAKANNVMIVTGAGVSVSCGIPDFRSETGIYSRLQEYALSDPQQMFDIEYFREAPEIFYSFAKELYPSNYEPSPSHLFVKLVEDSGKLLRNYTQNIDTLEHKANIKRVVNCHGSFATASCVTCGYKVDGKEIEPYISQQTVPPCPRCTDAKEAPADLSDDENDGTTPRGTSIMKPDITFFGERLPAEFDQLLAVDTDQVDLLIVMGSSLKVSPVSEIMSQIPHNVPQILINRTPITHMTFDMQLLGDCDVIVPELCRMLGWELKHYKLPGGSALSEESIKQSREGTGDLVEIVDAETKEVKHKEQKIWKYWRDGLYTFPGAVVSDRYLEGPEEHNKDDSDDDGDGDGEEVQHEESCTTDAHEENVTDVYQPINDESAA